MSPRDESILQHINRADLAQFDKENKRADANLPKLLKSGCRFFESGRISPHATPTEN